MAETGAHRQQIIETRRGQIFEIDRCDREDDALFRAQLVLLEAERAQPFGAATLHEAQIVGIEDDAGGIRVFVIDAHRPVETG